MHLPALTEIKSQKKQIIDFRGYNHNANINDGEFYEMSNLSSSLYPVLSPRKPRGTVLTFLKPNGLFAKNALAWVEGDSFVYDGLFRGFVTDSKKQFVSMGAYILIFPDKAYYNTATNVFGNLESHYTTVGSVTFTGCTQDGTTAEPASSLYVKITAPGVDTFFNRYDSITIANSTISVINKTSIIQTVGIDFIVIPAKIGANGSQTGITASRDVPDMDFLTESENRIWGCSSTKHEIYSCKLGDPFNWNCFEGISTDSYAVTVGSDGDFTGAITYLGYVLFFKEDCIHKLLGSKPSNYQVFENSVRGVAKGCEKSLVIVNETLYYMSRNGIVSYEGSIPDSISRALGNIPYSDAVAGSLGDKYYVSMKDTAGTYHLFVYDEKLGTWYREDNTRVSDFIFLGGKLYYIDSTSFLKTIEGADIEAINWYGEFSDFTEKTPSKKYVSRLQFRVELEVDSVFEAWITYDNNGIWEKLTTISSITKRVYNILVPVRRCDYYKIKLSGIGPCKLYSMTKTLIEGSDL